MSTRTILDLSGDLLEALTETLAQGGERAAELGRALDRLPVAAFAVGFGTPEHQVRDRSIFAGFLLAATRSSKVIIRADVARQHPINLARTVSTLSALHGKRIGLGASEGTEVHGWFAPPTPGARPSAAGYLRLVSALWDSWPLDAIAGDTEAGRYVDAHRIVRVSEPAYPGIGGPLTLPTDQTEKPPLVLLWEEGDRDDDGSGVDLLLTASGSDVRSGARIAYSAGDVGLVLGLSDLASLTTWTPSPQAGTAEVPTTIRAALGLGRSGRVARTEHAVFLDTGNAAQV
ncbi:hypothetical protein [Xylophilus sp.]|uniref:hypothetical protein n=1 Tax=Xylophilus sp. TaxID=2653893 RepID=UPI0013BDEE04|nr:hypothetical protein [Xylophilus sp.]KAF1044557.1 MAG: hypothetical protein GAK38_03495 [Xylophilus sp.]